MDTKHNYQIIWSPDFYKELTKVCNYISYTLNEYVIANNIYSKIINSILELKNFPEKCPRILNDITNRNLRRLIIDKYIIIYEFKLELNQINILHIFYYKQNYLEKL